MIEETDFETFLYISTNKYQIIIFDKKKLKNLYSDELIVCNELNFQDLKDLSKFLDDNIYKIEKLVGHFIKDIILIIENDNNLYVNISIKKKDYNNSINHKYLESNLTELKDLYKENYQQENVMHMLIISCTINGQKYSSFKENSTGNNLCLEVNFISISNELASKLSKVLEKYQVKINQYMCGNYVKKFLDHDHSEFYLTAHKLKNGHNDNEVILVPKNIENMGFFEKFFQLFS
jgi:hypothetical protein|tara:strand:+ start:396 stop:1100 length:705 start_codon:yes stop_codon:yes gene_type:complete